MKRCVAAGIASCLLLLTSGVGLAEPGGGPASSVAIRTLARFNWCYEAAPGTYVIQSQQELDELLTQQCGWTFSKWDPVDFDREYVVLYYDGLRGSGGNPFQVLGAKLKRGRIQLDLGERVGCVGGLVVVFPAVLMAVERRPLGSGVEAVIARIPCSP